MSKQRDLVTVARDAGASGYVNVTGDTMTGALTLSGGLTANGGVVVNEAGADADFRVEGDTDTHLMWTDASADRVVIGGSASDHGGLQINTETVFFKSATANLKFSTDGSTDGTGNARITVDDRDNVYGRVRFYCYTGASEQEMLQINGDQGSTAGGTTGRGVGFGHAGCWFDRGWGNYPSITVASTSSTGQTNQSQLRVHGTNATWDSYPDQSGGDFACSIYIDGTYQSSSDRRRKTNITDIEDPIYKILALSGKRYQLLNADGSVATGGSQNDYHFGFIAQDVEVSGLQELYKHYADEDDGTDGFNRAYSVDYDAVIPLLVEAIKQQQTQIEALTARVAALEGN